MLCVQCGATQTPAPQVPEEGAGAEQEMRPAALVAPPTFRPEEPEGEAVSATLNDAQTAGVLHAMVQTQVAQARVAARKADNYRVAELAAVIITRRDTTERDLAGFMSTLPDGAEDSQLLTRVQTEAQGVSGAMATLTGSAFDMAYVAGQIRELQHSLIVLDTRLVPDAEAPELQRIAKELRAATIDNLAAARALRNELIGGARR